MVYDNGEVRAYAVVVDGGQTVGMEYEPSHSSPTGNVDFPPGTHDVGELVIPRGALVRGAGRGRTLLRGRITVPDGTDVSISDLTLDCSGEPSDSDGISVVGAHRTSIRDVRVANVRRDGVVLDAPNGAPSYFATLHGVDVIAPGARRGFSITTSGGGWSTSASMTAVSTRGDIGSPVGVGFHFGSGVTDCTVTQSYAEMAGVGYETEAGATRVRLIGAFADGCGIGFKVRGDNLHAIFPETWQCSTAWDVVDAYLHTIIGRERVDVAGPVDSLRLKSLDNVLRLQDPRLHTIAMRSENRWDRVFSLKDETSGTDLIVCDGDGRVRLPATVRIGSIWLRDNAGSLEKSTDGTNWTAV